MTRILYLLIFNKLFDIIYVENKKRRKTLNKELFIKHVEVLGTNQHVGLQVDELLGSDVSCEGYVGDLINNYGDLLLEMTANGKEIPDDTYERFWNLIVNFVGKSTEDIVAIYEELIAL